MLQEIETQIVTVSPAAAQAVRDILTERKLDGYALRVFVSGSSCCGMQFGMALDNNVRDVDTVVEANGIKLVVDEVSLDHLRGASIDFVNDPERGSGFAINNPNAQQGCSDAGCGGSCSNNN